MNLGLRSDSSIELYHGHPFLFLSASISIMLAKLGKLANTVPFGNRLNADNSTDDFHGIKTNASDGTKALPCTLTSARPAPPKPSNTSTPTTARPKARPCSCP